MGDRHMRKLLVVVVFLWIGIFVGAQEGVTGNDRCTRIVESALTATDRACEGIEVNQACYGNIEITAELEDPDLSFSRRGDVVAVGDINRLQLSGLDEESAIWGVLLARVQASIPNTLPGQAVTLLAFGDTALSDLDDTMRAFTFQSGVGAATCDAAPDGMLVQTPDGTATVNFTINGVDIELGSTAFITAQPASDLTITLLEGQASVTSQGVTEMMQESEFIEVPLDAALVPSGPPSAAQPLPQPVQDAVATTLPLSVLPTNPLGPGLLPASGVWNYTVTGQGDGCGGMMDAVVGSTGVLGQIDFAMSDNGNGLTSTFDGTTTVFEVVGEGAYFDGSNDVTFEVVDENTMAVTVGVPSIPGCQMIFEYNRVP
jgi:hypothetical protein